MKTLIENNKDQPKSTAPKVQQEASTGGNATLEDNRSATIFQRKLRASIDSSASNRRAPIQRKANNTGLPNNLKSGIENLSGFAMDDVKVHYNSAKPAQLQAHAYAQGTDIHLAPGQEKHLPHEAWHVVQQKQGRVQPTRQLKSKVAINDDAGLESEADVMGAKALHGGGMVQRKGLQDGNVGAGVVQREEDDEWEKETVAETPVTSKRMREVGESFIVANQLHPFQNRDVVRNHKRVIPEAKIFVPSTGPTNLVTYISHGDHKPFKGTDRTTFPAPAGASLKYMIPHGYDAQAALSYPWEVSRKGRVGNFHDFSAGPQGRRFMERRWYDYELTQEPRHTALSVEVTAQRIAERNGVTVLVITNTVNTSSLVPRLVDLGYSEIYPIHCRGEVPTNRPEWTPVAYEDDANPETNLTKPEFERQDLVDTRADIFGDYSARNGKNWKIPISDFIGNDEFIDGTTYAAIPARHLMPGIPVWDARKLCHFRIARVADGEVYLRSITLEEFRLLCFDLAEEMDLADGRAEEDEARSTGRRRRALERYQERKDREMVVTRSMIGGDYVPYR